jgi:O-antigen/teichoic acid export membrane protein
MALPLLPVFFFAWVIQSSDSYILAYFHGEQSVGKYAVIYGLVGVILSITFALNFFWYPVSARLWIENREQYLKVFKNIFAGVLTALLVVVCLFEFNSSIIMKIFARRASYQDAHIIMGTIALAFSMQVLIALLTAPLYSNKNAKAIFFSYFIGGILNTILNILLIPKMDIIGAAISTAVAYLNIVIILGLLNYKLAKFPFIDSRIKYIIPIFGIIWISFGLIRSYLAIFEIILIDLVFVSLLLFVVYKLGLRSDERKYIINICRNLRIKKRLTG